MFDTVDNHFKLNFIFSVCFFLFVFFCLFLIKIKNYLKIILREKQNNYQLLNQLKNKSQSLDEIIEEKIQDLRKEQLKQLAGLAPLVDMGKLALGLVHNIRTPLAIISLLIDDLTLQKNIINQKKYKDHLTRAKNAVQMINDSANISKSQFSKDVGLDYFDLNNEIKKIVKLFNYKIKNEKIKIIFKPNKDYQLFAYREKLNQILVNLLMNSVEAFNGLEIDPKYIFIKIERNKHYLLVKIKDYASGIKKENLNNIFKARFSTKNGKESLGLGLYFCQEIMTKFYQSKIKVESIFGEGSTFTLRIKNKYILNSNKKN